MQPIMMIRQAPTSKQALLGHAKQLLQFYGGKLHIFDTVYIDGLNQIEGLNDNQRAEYRQRLIVDRELDIDHELRLAGMRKSDVIITVQWSKDLAQAALDYCRKIEPALVLKQCTTRDRHLNHTPTDWRLIERCPAPLLITANKRYRKQAVVLAAVDLVTKVRPKATLNHALVAAAQRHADALGATLHLVCCIPQSPLVADLDIIDNRELLRKQRQKVQHKVEQLQAEFGITEQHVHFKVGQPAKVIASTAKKLRAELVVLGAVGRRGIKGKLLGNTAEQLVVGLTNDLFLLKP